ncbi:MAG: hypothetical protein LPJ96_00630 [Exiguobacterium sp.]|uniref:hypothetical protein n=1 Tax=Exiguobacterium TaxID=33986 RepID=UPI0004A8EBDC|nr:hypothetical protein [Exiguobacterium sp. AB2]KDN58028.1 hypothetical protein DI14_03125 [Exiguobacterium sp. AB2]MDX5322093.1 hypothetical protein [Exiguobacterium sp.]MDX5423796.1 hypothetical protein [Exiguobacterium sp.]MDX6771344.1 hypothetical protein [Exiguobacterium sp.]
MIRYLPVLMIALIVGNLLTILGLTTNLSPLTTRLFLIGGPSMTVITAIAIVVIVLRAKK